MSKLPLEYLMVNSVDLDSDISSNLEMSRDSPDPRLFNEIMRKPNHDADSESQSLDQEDEYLMTSDEAFGKVSNSEKIPRKA